MRKRKRHLYRKCIIEVRFTTLIRTCLGDFTHHYDPIRDYTNILSDRYNQWREAVRVDMEKSVSNYLASLDDTSSFERYEVKDDPQHPGELIVIDKFPTSL